MTVRRTLCLIAACCAVLAGAGCTERQAPLPAETDEPLYVQAKQLIKQGRKPEALTYFLKVIERRGEAGAPESHLEAGIIYLYDTKDPVEAYHHLRRYVELQPNSKEASGVKAKIQDAQREFARTLPGRPLDDQSAKLQADEFIARLQKENDELRAQVATLRGGGAASLGRTPMISLPDEAQARPTPPPVTPVGEASVTTTAPAPAPRTTPATPANTAGLLNVSPASPANPPKSANPTRPGPTTATPPPAAASAPAGRASTHTIAPKETLYGIAMKYYGNGRPPTLRAIYLANRDVMRSENDIRPGMVLKIPPLEGAPAPTTRR